MDKSYITDPKVVKQFQEMCPHRNDNGSSVVAGQRIHLNFNESVFVCGFCQKEYNELTIPEYLKPSYIGGPVFNLTLNKIETYFYNRKSKFINKLILKYLKKFKGVDFE